MTREIQVGGVVEAVNGPLGGGGGDKSRCPHDGYGSRPGLVNLLWLVKLLWLVNLRGMVLANWCSRNRPSSRFDRNGVANRSNPHIVRVGDPESDARSSLKLDPEDLAGLVGVLPKPLPDAVQVRLLLVLDSVLLVSVVAESRALLVAFVLQDLDVASLILSYGHANYRQEHNLSEAKGELLLEEV